MESETFTIDEQNLHAFCEHLDDCPTCGKHRGHLPFGLCDQGQKLFIALNEEGEPEDA